MPSTMLRQPITPFSMRKSWPGVVSDGPQLCIAHWWLQPDLHTSMEVLKRVNMDWFLSALPGRVRQAVDMKADKTMQDMVITLECALTTQGMGREENMSCSTLKELTTDTVHIYSNLFGEFCLQYPMHHFLLILSQVSDRYHDIIIHITSNKL